MQNTLNPLPVYDIQNFVNLKKNFGNISLYSTLRVGLLGNFSC